MRLELRHLRAVRAIHQQGGLARAAEVLNITQSALSHQIKGMEEQAGVELFLRSSKPMRLSPSGMRLLRVADQVLPLITAAESEFRALEDGRAGRLHVAIECHACFDWLLPVMEQFRRAWPEVDVDVRAAFSFGALPALARSEIDLVLSSDPEDLPGIQFTPLFEYAPTFIASAQNPLAQKQVIEPADFADQTLICYPTERGRLDVFSQFLTPARVEPAAIRQVDLTAMILMLVASDRGVAVVPDWVLREVRYSAEYVTRPLAGRPIRRMFAATRSEDASLPYVANFQRLCRVEPVRQARP